MNFHKPEGAMNYLLEWVQMPALSTKVDKLHNFRQYAEYRDLFNLSMLKKRHRLRPAYKIFHLLPIIIKEIDFRYGDYSVALICKLVNKHYLDTTVSYQSVLPTLQKYADLGIIPHPKTKDELWDYEPFAQDTRIPDVRQKSRLKQTREERKAANKRAYENRKRNMKASQGFPEFEAWLLQKYPEHSAEVILSDLDANPAKAVQYQHLSEKEVVWKLAPKHIASQYRAEIHEVRMRELDPAAWGSKRKARERTAFREAVHDGMAHALKTQQEAREVYIIDTDDPAFLDGPYEFSTPTGRKAGRGMRLLKMYEEALKEDPHLTLSQAYEKLKEEGKLPSNGPYNRTLSRSSFYQYINKQRELGREIPKRQKKPRKSYYQKKLPNERKLPEISRTNKDVLAYTELQKFLFPAKKLSEIWQDLLPIFGYTSRYNSFVQLVHSRLPHLRKKSANDRLVLQEDPVVAG